MFQIRKQLSKLYLLTVWGNISLSGAWVAILAARGFSLVEIGFAETVFHITSILFEIPSGALADVIGRKRMLLASSISRMIANVIMIISWNFLAVCVSLAFHALSYNFLSGSHEALAYESLKYVGEEARYEKYISNQISLYRICGGVSTLCAGFALTVGYKVAYGTGVITGVIETLTVLALAEVRTDKLEQRAGLFQAVIHCFKESICFFYREKKIVSFMLCNSLIGAVDVLLVFFLEAKMPTCGMPRWLLGPALLLIQMGGVAGSRLILRLKHWKFQKVFIVAAFLVILGVLVEHTGVYLIMMLGGFLSAIGDDAMQVHTNAKMQEMIPSEQRATIASVDSFLFSCIMIVFSPLAGFVFSIW